MDRIQFSGLPESFRVGPAALLPRSIRDVRLQRCCVCKKVSVDYYLCASRHSYCPDCIPPSIPRRSWCVLCADNVEFETKHLPSTFLEGSIFSCPCSFTGRLSEIREHLLSTNNPGLCFSRTAVEDEHRSETSSPSQETLDSLIRDLDQTRLSLRRHEATIPMLVEGLSTMQIICDILSCDRKIFCFDFPTLSRREAVEHHKVVDGVPLRIQVAVVGLEDERFLSVSVAGSCIAARNAKWPLRKCISVQILDMNGQSLATWEVPTFEHGDYTHETFRDPTLESPSPGVCFLVSLAAILQCYPRDGVKYLLLSASVKNIPV